MRILYLHQYFNTPEMAGSTRSYEMGRQLVSYGHEVHMVTSYRYDDQVKQDWFETFEDGIKVHWVPVAYSNKMSYLERFYAFLKFAWYAAIKSAEIECDFVFATSTPLTIALPAVYASKKKKVPMVFEVRDLWPELPIAIGVLKNPFLISSARWLEVFAYRHAAHVIALSPGMKEGVARTGYPENKITVIPNSCDLELFKVTPEKGRAIREKHEWLKNRPLVIYAGTIGRINGVDYLARLAAAVLDLDQEIRFVIIGSGQEENKVRELASSLSVLNRNFFMLNRVPKKDLVNWLAAADVATSLFVDLKEMWANSANKFFDALAAGKPIVINYGGWQAGIIKETGAGLVLSPKDVAYSARMLVDRINDKEWLEETGLAASQLARESFDRNKLAEELEKVLRSVVNK